jgi:BRCT domain type II-containing protein
MLREDAVTYIEANGGTFHKTVRSNTDYLITGDKIGATKLNKAKACGTKILTEKTFMDIINNKQTPKPNTTTITPVKPKVESQDLTLNSREW